MKQSNVIKSHKKRWGVPSAAQKQKTNDPLGRRKGHAQRLTEGGEGRGGIGEQSTAEKRSKQLSKSLQANLTETSVTQKRRAQYFWAHFRAYYYAPIKSKGLLV